MGFIKGIFNAVADPRLFFLLAVLALVVVVWKRQAVASNAVGYGLLGGLAVFYATSAPIRNSQMRPTGPVLSTVTVSVAA
jgi:hypothetical protein